MNRIFVDMDGVAVDFDKFKSDRGLSGEAIKSMPRAYTLMDPIPGAISGINSLVGMGFEVWLATKPPTGIPYAYADKVQWVLDWLPNFKRKIILTHDKGLLGDSGDYLIDDRPHRANCGAFSGTLLKFGDGVEWPAILEYFKRRAPRKGVAQAKE